MFGKRILASVVAASLLLSGAPSLAQPQKAPSASDKETARALMKDGETKRAKNDNQAALQSFRAAHAIMNVPTTGLELGRTQADLGLLVEARDTLLSVTRLPVVAGESANMAAARDEAQKLADEIEPRIPSLTLELSGVPAGTVARVTIDAHAIQPETIGVARKHNPGPHEIVVVAGPVEKKQHVDLVEGESKTLTIDLSPAASPADDAPAPAEEEPRPAPVSNATSPLVWIGFGSATAFVLAGGVTGALAFSRASSAKEGCDGTRCPPSTHDDLESSKTFGNLSTIAFLLAGAGVVVGVIGLYSSKSESSKSESSKSESASNAKSGAAATTSLGLYVAGNGFGLTGSF